MATLQCAGAWDCVLPGGRWRLYYNAQRPYDGHIFRQYNRSNASAVVTAAGTAAHRIPGSFGGGTNKLWAGHLIDPEYQQAVHMCGIIDELNGNRSSCPPVSRASHIFELYS